ncbi:MAG: hypothetical protein R3296_04560 [Oleiphilaceae bacterium]|nr:hypothetical protein [Oleiphilaceae bacterium]
MSQADSSTPDVRSMTVDELLALFATLEAPDLSEMDGEYQATLLRQPGLVATLAGQLTVNNPFSPGKWLCKAFRPVDNRHGRGYNTFRQFGRVVQRFPMHTVIAPSRYDGQPAYQLVYRAYQSLCGDIHMVDEVRRLGEGRYLGIGTWGFSDRQRQVPLPFLLTGPVAAYRGDIGKERPSFRLEKEIPAFSVSGQRA